MVSQKSVMPSEHPRVFIKKYFKPMARDLGEDIHKIFELPIKGISNILWYLVLLSCHQTDCPRPLRCKGGKEDNHGKKEKQM